MALACVRCVALRPGADTCPTCQEVVVEVDTVHPSVEAAGGDARPVFDALRRWRGRQARLQGMEPYMVVPNRTLALLAFAQPETREAFEAVDGIGPVKARNYGYTLMAWFKAQHGGEAPDAPQPVSAPVPDGLTPVEEALLFDLRGAAAPLPRIASARGWTLDRLAVEVQGLILKGAPDVGHMLVAPLDMATMSEFLDAHEGADEAALAGPFPHTSELQRKVLVALAEHRRRTRRAREE